MNKLFNPDDETIKQIHAQLAHLREIGIGGHLLAAEKLPTVEQICEFIETAFWVSLESNEGCPTRVFMIFGSPANCSDVIKFETPIPFGVSQITNLAPAVSQNGAVIVYSAEHDLHILGFGRNRHMSWMHTISIEVSEPGTIRINIGPYRPYVVFNRGFSSNIEGTHANLAAYVNRIMGIPLPVSDIIETNAVWRERLELAKILREIINDRHGGIVLIVPNENGQWSNSLTPFAYRFASPDSSIPDIIRNELKDGNEQGKMLQKISEWSIPDEIKNIVLKNFRPISTGIENIIQSISSLAGIDGAIVITKQLKILGFGAKIAIKDDGPPKICMFRPVPGQQEVIESPLEDLGGTRHQSSARFVASNKDSIAIVISQDGHMSIMHWNEEFKSVFVLRNAELWT